MFTQIEALTNVQDNTEKQKSLKVKLMILP